jgi:hypothetical protein
MISIDKSKFRDPAYLQRLEQLEQRLADIEADGSFIAYASNRDVLEDLETLISENLQRYNEDYLANVQALKDFRDSLHQQKETIHPTQFQSLEAQAQEVEKKLHNQHYAENASSKSMIEALANSLQTFMGQFAAFGEGRRDYEAKLKALAHKIWQEFYIQLESPLKEFQESTKMPDTHPWTWPEAQVKEAIAAREQAFEALLKVVKGHRRYKKQVLSAQDSPISKADFDKLNQKIQKGLKRGNVKGFILVGATVIIVALAAWQAPALLNYLNEEKVWEQSLQTDTWGSYQQYLKNYPAGKYIAKARERQLLLDYGSIENIITDDGQVYAYEGELDAGKAHGQGIATFSNGDTYEGGWKAGQFWGQGTLAYAAGGSYAGEWEADRFHGSGTLEKANGDTYTGSWKQGLQSGQGSMLYADGSKYLGSWQEGLPHGHGTFSAGKDQNIKLFDRQWDAEQSYAGDWVNGKPDGTGIMRYDKEQRYQGKWKSGMRHGKGKLHLPGNSHFDGTWQADSLYGEGVFTSRFREETRGIWKGSPLRVKLTDAFGLTTKVGKFENGLFVSQK